MQKHIVKHYACVCVCMHIQVYFYTLYTCIYNNYQPQNLQPSTDKNPVESFPPKKLVDQTSAVLQGTL